MSHNVFCPYDYVSYMLVHIEVMNEAGDKHHNDKWRYCTSIETVVQVHIFFPVKNMDASHAI